MLTPDLEQSGDDPIKVLLVEDVPTDAELTLRELKRAATDYILKTNMARLAPAVRRALKDQEDRQAKRKAEAALEETKQRFELFMRHLPGAAFMKDRCGAYCYVNSTWEKLTGKTL